MRSPGSFAMPLGSSFSDSVWKLSRIRPRCGWSARLDDLPGLTEKADEAAPRERLVADPQAAPRGALGELVQLRRGPCRVVEGQRRRVRADQHQRRAERLHHVELALGADQALAEFGLGHALEIAERLVQVDAEAEIGGHRAKLGGAAVEVDEVVLEQLDAVEARGGDRLELLPQGAAHRDRRDRPAHGDDPSVADLRDGAELVGGRGPEAEELEIGRNHARTACRCRPGSRAAARHARRAGAPSSPDFITTSPTKRLRHRRARRRTAAGRPPSCRAASR